MKWKPLLASVLAGAALMFVLGEVIGIVVPYEILSQWSFYILLVIGVLCYFVTGVMAGYWVNWKGGTTGGVAGIILLHINIGISIYRDPMYLIFLSQFIFSYWILFILSFVFGAIGGSVGERLYEKNSKPKANA